MPVLRKNILKVNKNLDLGNLDKNAYKEESLDKLNSESSSIQDLKETYARGKTAALDGSIPSDIDTWSLDMQGNFFGNRRRQCY